MINSVAEVFEAFIVSMMNCMLASMDEALEFR